MAGIAFPGEPGAARKAFEQLYHSACGYPVELTQGIVLLHARCGDLARPLLMVCHAPGGWPLPDLPEPPGIILVLLGSQTQSPELHLRNLSAVARRIHGTVKQPAFVEAGHAATLCQLIQHPPHTHQHPISNEAENHHG